MSEEFKSYKEAIFHRPLGSLFNIYLMGPMYDATEHVEKIETIRSSGPNDEIHLYITSVGGDVDISDMYLSAIRDSGAFVVTHGVGLVASAAVSIFLAGDKCIPEEGSFYMMHNVQLATEGDLALITTRVDFYREYYLRRLKEEYGKVLTPQELDNIFKNGAEVYLNSQQMGYRLDKTEKRKIIITLNDCKKEILVDTISVDDFKELSFTELKNVLFNLDGTSLDPLKDYTWWDVAEEIIRKVRSLASGEKKTV